MRIAVAPDTNQGFDYETQTTKYYSLLCWLNGRSECLC